MHPACLRAAVLTWVAALVLPAANAGWRLEHAEDFSAGRPLDSTFWRVESGFQRNHESQYYTPGNLRIADGALTFEARKETRPNADWREGARDWRQAARSAQYTSASIVARREMLFGRIEVVARSPSGAGVWPAIWLLHEREREYGEIDVFEAVGKHPDTVFAAVHYGRDAPTRQHRGGSLHFPGFEGSWRTHSLEWTPDRIVMAVDGRQVFAFDPRAAAAAGADPLRRPMYLHLNLALGGSWGGPIDDARLPARFQVSSIKIWRWQPDDGVPAIAATAASAARAEPSAPPPDAPPAMRWGR